MSKAANIFIVDDHQLVIDGLEKILGDEADFRVIGSASNGQEAIKRIRIIKPDLVLMDMDMPLMNGMEASQNLLKETPDLKIAILTMHAERAIVEKMMKIGVSGYFVKNADKLEFIQGIRLILAGKKFFHSEALSGFSGNTSQVSVNQSSALLLSQLSPREIDVLKLIAMGKTSKEIANELNISPRTVETHRKNMHQKLEIQNLAGLIRFAIKSGLVN